ncbi:hypothetical protein BIW11_04725 [Tropilaelaps mercedesae]|uniref:Uncharacterized protein n=1 Tax=Tropilaelaps mercedesae TaxID=418985 RepID=A0A1V9X2B5_9ACAR|nr:hypothetical protein BIW11_04725 [Tropilaelaps mercedesae]
MASVVQNPPGANSIVRKDLKPLDAKDLQVSFILPAVTESSVVLRETPNTSTGSPSSVDIVDRNVDSTDDGARPAMFDIEQKYGKPYPMQRAAARPDDRKDTSPTVNPVVALAGAETSTEDTEKYILACPPKDQIHPCTCTEVGRCRLSCGTRNWGQRPKTRVVAERLPILLHSPKHRFGHVLSDIGSRIWKANGRVLNACHAEMDDVDSQRAVKTVLQA